MMLPERRQFLRTTLRASIRVACAASMLSLDLPALALGSNAMPERDKWLDSWYKSRRLGPPLHVQKFPERIYALLVPISWEPEPAKQAEYRRVEAPRGFVTDFASIPRPFWSLLPPDGPYTYAAVIHDWLYWEQDPQISRRTADEIFRFAMIELRVAQQKVDAIYTAVRRFGQAAWNENSRAKGRGEKRVLARLPDDPRITWAEWSKREDVWQKS